VVPDYTAPPADVAPPEQAFEPPVITVRKKAKPAATLPFPEDQFQGFPTRHPYVNNPDGSQSNVKLGTWEIDGKTYAIPTMVDGKQLSDEEALKTAKSYGFRNYPSFKNQNEAEGWIQQYHGAIGEDGKIKNPESKSHNKTLPFPTNTPPIGKITSYGYTNDSYGDTNTEKQMGAWGPITEYGVALSPDKEKEARAKGIKPLDKIEMVLEDGSTVVRQWNDRTMQDAQAIKKYGKPLTGRFDIHAGWGKDKLPQDDMRVVDFRKAQ